MRTYPAETWRKEVISGFGFTITRFHTNVGRLVVRFEYSPFIISDTLHTLRVHKRKSEKWSRGFTLLTAGGGLVGISSPASELEREIRVG